MGRFTSGRTAHVGDPAAVRRKPRLGTLTRARLTVMIYNGSSIDYRLEILVAARNAQFRRELAEGPFIEVAQ